MLTPESFRSYPDQARQLAVSHIDLLSQLPLSFLPLLLREVINYDWKFPVEREELDYQFAYLSDKSAAELAKLMAPFAQLKLSAELEKQDWVNAPVQFSEQLSAYLWATHQIDAFRSASVDYVHGLNASKDKAAQPPQRLGMVAIGNGVVDTRYRLFRYLRRLGVYYTNIAPEQGIGTFKEHLTARAKSNPVPFAHWYIDGADIESSDASLTCVSYNSLRPIREALLSKMVTVMRPGGGGPELLRTELARMQPKDVGLSDAHDGPVLSRFKLALLTEGSGTQIFSTSFVEWSAREALRRAQPHTLLARFTPRRREASIHAPGLSTPDSNKLDPEASLIDADMGAYYTWINQQRLPGAEKASFIVWFEGHSEAVAIGPSLRAGTEDSRLLRLQQVMDELGKS
ncbi:MAG: hypothetical protein JO061_12555 [Acidobacteriaceae bacterium]|nr:hypothetical protein [Acidobacteriaceae bacterium]